MPYVCGVKDVDHNTVYCGCTIISENFVLTSAYCLSNRTMNTLQIMVGTSDYRNPSYSRYGSTYPVLEVIIHPDFRYNALINNIAMARVPFMEFNPAVQAVCLPMR